MPPRHPRSDYDVTAKSPRTHFKPRGPFSALTGRILALNIVALAFLVGGVLYLNQLRTGLIDTRLSALVTQTEVIAGALGEAATEGPDASVIEIERAKQILARLVVPTQVRARLFDASGGLLIDSRDLFSGSEVVETGLRPPNLWNNALDYFERTYERVVRFLARGEPLPLYVEPPRQRAEDYEEAVIALSGNLGTAARTLEDGGILLSAAVPVQRFKRVLGALLASVETSEIEELVRQERLAILEVFAIALLVTVILSYILARTIARPVHKLAETAEKVRRGRGRNIRIPDFSNRRDEIGDLSRALKDMTEALYGRIDAVEAFAADVAHEIKNPLTSLRSAVETFARTGDAGHQAKLLEIIKDDVKRIDRLISDISEASRIDAEMSRADRVRFDIGLTLRALVEAYRTTHGLAANIELDIPEGQSFMMQGVESKLGQVVRNLLDNAVSFSRNSANQGNAAIRVGIRRQKNEIIVTIDDNGPGIPEAMLDDIFLRFYTERPEGEAFGTHSGLGLSISRQIVEAHGGKIKAQNRYQEISSGSDGHHDAGCEDDKRKLLGARFTVRLPV